MMKPFDAILFDLDGTLIDSEYFHYECWNEIMEEYKVKLTYEDWLKNYAGIPLPVNAKNLLEKYGINASLPDVINRREALTLERLKTKDVNLMPFALDIIRFFHEKNLIMAIVTSSPRADVEAVFERNGLKKYFKLIITRTDVLKSKPDPESYDRCCELLNISKDRCLVFEDTLNGIKAAKAANIVCYAVQSDITAHERLNEANRIFSDLNEAKDYLIKNQLIA